MPGSTAQKPTGLGKWTDVAAYEAPPAPAGPAQGPPDQVGVDNSG